MYKYERKLVQSYNLKIWKSILYSAKKKKKKKHAGTLAKFGNACFLGDVWHCNIQTIFFNFKIIFVCF
jgi:hypothetical protein